MRVCRSVGGCVCVVVSLALAGCFQSSTLVKLNPDGSGTVEQTLTMNAQTLAQLSSLQAMGNSKDGASAKAESTEPFSEADAKAQAAKMGEGVTFVSSQKIQNGQFSGRKAIYAFKDVRKLALEEVNAPASGTSGMTTKSDDPPMTFTFKQLPNGDGLLTIDNAAARKGSGLPGGSGDGDANNPQAMQMMKMFLQGLKVDVAVQVGRIVKTNIPYVQGSTATLLSMDFDQLLADPTAFDRIQKAKTPDETRAALKTVKGIEVNLDPQLTLEFSSR